MRDRVSVRREVQHLHWSAWLALCIVGAGGLGVGGGACAESARVRFLRRAEDMPKVLVDYVSKGVMS